MSNTILKILIIFVFIFIGIEGWLMKETWDMPKQSDFIDEYVFFRNKCIPDNNCVDPSELYKFNTTFKIYRTYNVIATCYTASPDETDDSPFITANGTDLRKTKDNVIAANWLPFGTKVEIDGKEYVVHDRMNKRYSKYRVDILVGSKKEAMKCEQNKILKIIN